MTLDRFEALEDVKAAAAFDGPSTPEERLEYRIGGAAHDLHVLAQDLAPREEIIAKACEVIVLASRLQG